MKMPTAEIKEFCSQRSELAAYIDGELSAREECAIETHLAACAACRSELNEQKKLLCVLNLALDDEKKELELPRNFTKIVIANAESKVSGLRHPQERSKALIVCAGLFGLVIVLGLGGETTAVINTFAAFAEQFLAVAGFVLRLFYDIALGAAIVLRSIGSQLIFNSTISLALTICVFAVCLFALLRLIVRVPKLKIQSQEK